MAGIPDLEAHLTPGLRAEAEKLMKLRGLPTPGFYGELMVHPELFERVKALGTFLRFHGVLPARVREAAILCAAVVQRSSFEWDTHQATAREAGLDDATIAAIGSGGPLPDDLEAVRGLVTVVLCGASVPQGLFDRLRGGLGLQGVVELVTLTAFYAMMARLGASFDSAMPGAPPPPWEGRGGA